MVGCDCSIIVNLFKVAILLGFEKFFMGGELLRWGLVFLGCGVMDFVFLIVKLFVLIVRLGWLGGDCEIIGCFGWNGGCICIIMLV
jgi:hypothetical protein